MKKYILLGLIFLGLFFSIMQLPFKAKSLGDLTFHEEAKNISQYLLGNGSIDSVMITKAPGPVFFYVLPYILAGKTNDDGRLWKFGTTWNALWLLIALILVYKSACLLFGKRAGISSIVLSLILPLQLYYGIGILAETLAFVGYAFFLYGTIAIFKLPNNERKSNVFIYGLVIIGLIMMVTARPNMLLLMAFIPFVLIWLYWKSDRVYATLLKKYFYSYLLAAILIVGILGVLKNLPGNKNKPDQESYFSFVAHLGRFQFRAETWDWRFWDDITRPDSKDYQNWAASTHLLNGNVKTSGLSTKKIYNNWVLQDIKENPILVTKQFFVRLLFGNFLQISSAKPEKFKVGPVSGSFVFYVVHFAINIINLAIIIAAFFGFFKCFRTHKFILLLALPLLALLFFNGFIYMEQRYLFPARSFYIIFSSGVFLNWFNKIKYNAS